MNAENQIPENDPAPDAGSEANIKTDHAKPSVVSSLPPPKLPPSHTHYRIACEKEEDWWEQRKRWAELGGLVLLGVYTGFTIMIYCANKKAADAAEIAAIAAKDAAKTADESFRLSSRAWMNATLSNPGGVADEQPIRLAVDFVNTGKSPALNVRTCQIAKFVKGGQFTNIHCSPEATSPGTEVILADGDTKRLANAVGAGNVPPIAVDGLLTAPLHEELRKGKQTAITYGFIEYDDIFKVHHWTTFCSYLLILPSTPGGLRETNNWAKCSVGNDIDQNYQ
jgi:hypothetical protein